MPINLNEFSSKASSIAASARASAGSSITSLRSDASSALAGVESKLQGLTAAGNLSGLGSLIRAKNLLANMNGGNLLKKTSASFVADKNAAQDWRVRLSIPFLNTFAESPLLTPLVKETNGLVFPYTPSISMVHSANYQALEPLHNNYSFFAYQNSRIEAISISGQFYCEDSNEAAYWIGATHYLRSITKMSTGDSANSGSPPPVVYLNGYGPHVFKDIPVVVTSFTIELPNDVDYISAQVAGEVSHVPTKSTISVTVQPIYSRDSVRRFNLDDFVKGNYLSGGRYL